MKNEENESGKILFHLGQPELKDVREYRLKEDTQNQQKNAEKDGPQMEKKEKKKKSRH